MPGNRRQSSTPSARGLWVEVLDGWKVNGKHRGRLRHSPSSSRSKNGSAERRLGTRDGLSAVGHEPSEPGVAPPVLALSRPPHSLAALRAASRARVRPIPGTPSCIRIHGGTDLTQAPCIEGGEIAICGRHVGKYHTEGRRPPPSVPRGQGRLPIEHLSQRIEVGIRGVTQHLIEKAVLQLPANWIGTKLSEASQWLAPKIFK